jgi:Putative peptidoglycan binding domain
MKKVICLFVLLALAPGVHADDNKKKKPQSHSAHPSAPGGGGGTGLPSMSHGISTHDAGQTGNHSNTHANTHGSTSATNRMTGHSTSGEHSSNPMSKTAGQQQGNEHSSNPLLRKHSPEGSNGQSSNPLTRNNGQANANHSNPLAKKSASQSTLNGRNANAMTKRNGNLNGNHAFAGQNSRNFNNRVGARAAQRGYANYHVRSYREVFHNYHAIRHDRFWYSNHYDRVVVMGGGYYYWDGGYWYPAWGYDPTVSFYAFDGPIYSYYNLPPDQVIVNVQTELQDQGYYTGDVDGQLGPQTRDALSAYQSDHNLEVTSAVDEPTVEALGLTGST